MNSKNQANVNGFFMKANSSLSGPNDPIMLLGDIIATGTPEGVGPMKTGDRVRIAIEHLGEMNLDVRAA